MELFSSLCWPIRSECSPLICGDLIGRKKGTNHFSRKGSRIIAHMFNFSLIASTALIISPEGCFSCYKTVIIQGGEINPEHVQKRENVFLCMRGDREWSPLSEKQGNFRCVSFHMWNVIKHTCFLFDSYINFPLWGMEKWGLLGHSLVKLLLLFTTQTWKASLVFPFTIVFVLYWPEGCTG